MKLKRIIALALTAMLTLSLCGCSEDEIGFLNMYTEISEITQIKVNGLVGINDQKLVSDDRYDLILDIKYSGYIDITDNRNPYFDINLSFITPNGQLHPIELYLYDNTLYFSKNSLYGLNDLSNYIYPRYSYGDYTPVIDLLLEILPKDFDYISIDLNTYYMARPNVPFIQYELLSWIPNGNNSFSNNANLAITSALKDFFLNTFKYFDSWTVTKTDDGYSLNLTPQIFSELFRRSIIYINDNFDEFYDSFKTLLVSIYSNIEDFEPDSYTIKNLENFISEMDEKREDARQSISLISNSYINEPYSYYSVHDNNSFISNTIKLTNEGFNITVSSKSASRYIDPPIADERYSNVNIIKSDVSKIVPQSSITLSDVALYFEEANKIINPVYNLEISWNESTRNIAYQNEINKTRPFYDATCRKFSKSNVQIDNFYRCFAIFSNESLYVPIRYIAESFNEEVIWNEYTQTAAIVRDNQTYTFNDGFLNTPYFQDFGEYFEECYYVKLRDFEKLGYIIEYRQEEVQKYYDYYDYYKNIVTITKPE